MNDGRSPTGDGGGKAPRETDLEAEGKATRDFPPQGRPAPPAGFLSVEVQPPQPRPPTLLQNSLRFPSYNNKALDPEATTSLHLSRRIFSMILLYILSLFIYVFWTPTL